MYRQHIRQPKHEKLKVVERKVKEILKKNSYPSGIIEQSKKSFLKKLHIPKKIIPIVAKKELFIVRPYLGTMSSNLKQKLRTCFKYSLSKCNMKILIFSFPF